MSCRTAAAGSGQCVRACAVAAGPELPADPAGGCKRGGRVPHWYLPAALCARRRRRDGALGGDGGDAAAHHHRHHSGQVLVMVTAGKTTQALTSRKKDKETAANDGIAE